MLKPKPPAIRSTTFVIALALAGQARAAPPADAPHSWRQRRSRPSPGDGARRPRPRRPSPRPRRRPRPTTTKGSRSSRCRRRPIATPGAAPAFGWASASRTAIWSARGRAERPAAGIPVAARHSARPRLVAAGVVPVRAASTAGGLDGLRFSGTLDPTWHVTSHLSLAVGLGFGGIVEGSTSRPEVDAAAGLALTLVHLSERSPPLPSCSGVGVAGAGARRVDDRARAALGDQLRARGGRPVDRLRRRHRPGRRRHRPGDRAAAVVAAHRRDGRSGGSRGDERAAARRRVARRRVRSSSRRARASRETRADAGAADADAERRRRGGADAAAARRRGARATPRRASSRRARSATPNVPYPPGAPPQTAPVVVTVKLLVDTAGAVQKVEVRTPAAADLRRRGRRRGARVSVRARALRRRAGAGRDHVHAHVPAAATAAARAAGRRGPGADGGAARQAGRARHARAGHRRDRHRRGRRSATTPSTPTGAGASGCRCRRARRGCRSTRRATTRSCSRRRWRPSRSWRSPTSSSAIATTPTRSWWSASSAARRSRASRCAAREMQQIPGTFGDPFRVIQTLPGVASVVSLLPFPVVRGASPSSTGFLLDGTRSRCSITCSSGPASSTPSSSTRSSSTRAARRRPTAATPAASSTGARRARAPTSTCSTSTSTCCRRAAFVREPIPQLGVTLHGGGALRLSRASCSAWRPTRLSLSYWDYQLRLDGGNARNGWTVFAFGANDELDTRRGDRRPRAARPRRSRRR